MKKENKDYSYILKWRNQLKILSNTYGQILTIATDDPNYSKYVEAHRIYSILLNNIEHYLEARDKGDI